MDKTYIIANWKMNPALLKQTEHLFEAVSSQVKNSGNTKTIVAPPFVWLSLIAHRFSERKIGLAGQDCFWEDKGAFTGAVSPVMLKELGASFVIIGHSERRKYFCESDETINKKVKAALKHRLKPILCLGEEARDAFDSQGRPINEMSLAVGEQLKKGLADVPSNRLEEIIIVYEPVWAISTHSDGKACLPDDAMKAALFIRKTLSSLYSRSLAEKAAIVYGGSVNSKNVASFLKEAGMNGVLVGSASLSASEFVKIIKIASEDCHSRTVLK